MTQRIIGGVVVALRVVVENQSDLDTLKQVVASLREKAEDMPWTDCGELADTLEEVTRRLVHVAPK